MTGSTRRFRLDPSTARADGGRVLVGGSPMTLMRLSSAGAQLVDRIAAGDAVDLTPTVGALVDRLLDAGLAHPVMSPAATDPSAAEVTVVIPAHSVAPTALSAIVASCAGVAEVIVVDDASPVPIDGIDGATVVRRDVNGGPAAARTTGLQHVGTPLVAFVDADVTPPAGWLQGLLPHLADERVALVAPRVATSAAEGRLARYESVRSPLDLGRTPARVRAGQRVSYVPAAALLVRVAALDAVGGFDDDMRLGEDVDLVWRLDDGGWRVRYEPSVVVQHAARRTLAAFVRQRFGYGSSGAALAQRHEGALAPVRVTRWAAVSWAALGAGFPVVGIAALVMSTRRLTRTLRRVPDSIRISIRLAVLGHTYAGRSIAGGITRAWWPIAAVAAVVSPRCRRAVAAAVLVPAAYDWWHDRPPLDPATYVALRVVDDAAYGSGLIVGAVRAGSLDALRPQCS